MDKKPPFFKSSSTSSVLTCSACTHAASTAADTSLQVCVDVPAQGWRLEIKSLPKLTEVGAWRGKDSYRHGGFYSQDEVIIGM